MGRKLLAVSQTKLGDLKHSVCGNSQEAES